MGRGWKYWAGGIVAAAVAAGCSGESSVADAGPAPAAGEPDQIDWQTTWSTFRARVFSIGAGGTDFVVGDADVSVSGDYAPGEYTTVEATWTEHDVTMRVNVYIHSDGVEWWSDEIRTADGTAPAEWITYEGEWFRSPVGHSYVGDLHLETPAGAPIAGRLDATGLVVQAFVEPNCDGAAFTLRSWARFVDVPLSPTAGFRNLVDVLDADCNVVDDVTPFEFESELDDPIATVERDGDGWDFSGVAVGETLWRLRLREVASGDLLAEIAVPVIVYEPD